MLKLLILLFCCVVICYGNNLVKLNENNHIVIRGRIDDNSVNNFINDSLHINDELDDIYIYINSPGGSVHSGNAILQNIYALSQTKKIHCVCDFCASMAFVIFQGCEYRHVLHNSVLMQHQMSLQVNGKLEEINNYLQMIYQINNSTNLMQSNRTKLSLTEFNNKVSNDWWTYGNNAITENVADDMIYVLCDKKLLNIKKNIMVQTFFNNILLTYSGCPLMRKYISYSLEDNTKNNSTIINNLIDEFTGYQLYKNKII